MTDSKELVKREVRSGSVAEYLNEDKMASLLKFSETILQSGLVPLKTKEAVATALLMGKALGVSEMVAVNNIYSVNGKAGLGVHLISAQILKAGVTYEVVKDYAPLYVYRDRMGVDYEYGDEFIDWSKVFLATLPLANEDAKQTENRKAKVKAEEDKGKIPLVRILVDRITTIKFTREIKDKIQTHTESFKWSEAKLAELAENEKKENWMKYPKKMLFNRCFVFGARAIASDAILGLMEAGELADLENADIVIDENSNVIIEENKVVNKTKDNEHFEEAQVIEETAPVSELNTDVTETTEETTINAEQQKTN